MTDNIFGIPAAPRPPEQPTNRFEFPIPVDWQAPVPEPPLPPVHYRGPRNQPKCGGPRVYGQKMPHYLPRVTCPECIAIVTAERKKKAAKTAKKRRDVTKPPLVPRKIKPPTVAKKLVAKEKKRLSRPPVTTIHLMRPTIHPEQTHKIARCGKLKEDYLTGTRIVSDLSLVTCEECKRSGFNGAAVMKARNELGLDKRLRVEKPQSRTLKPAPWGTPRKRGDWNIGVRHTAGYIFAAPGHGVIVKKVRWYHVCWGATSKTSAETREEAMVRFAMRRLSPKRKGEVLHG